MDQTKSAELTLYYYPQSLPCRTILMIVSNLGLDNVKKKIIDIIADEHLKKEFQQINPKQLLPTLKNGLYITWTSKEIAKYLMTFKTTKQSLRPTNLLQWKEMEEILDFESKLFRPTVQNICFSAALTDEWKIPEKLRINLKKCFTHLNGILALQEFLAGDSITIADIFVLSSLITILNAGANINPYKYLLAWYAQCKLLPGFVENNQAAKIYGSLIQSRNRKFFESIYNNKELLI